MDLFGEGEAVGGEVGLVGEREAVGLVGEGEGVGGEVGLVGEREGVGGEVDEVATVGVLVV